MATVGAGLERLKNLARPLGGDGDGGSESDCSDSDGSDGDGSDGEGESDGGDEDDDDGDEGDDDGDRDRDDDRDGDGCDDGDGDGDDDDGCDDDDGDRDDDGDGDDDRDGDGSDSDGDGGDEDDGDGDDGDRDDDRDGEGGRDGDGVGEVSGAARAGAVDMSAAGTVATPVTVARTGSASRAARRAALLARRFTAAWASATVRAEPARPESTAYGAIKYADSSGPSAPVSRGARTKKAAATSSGPTAPEVAAPTPRWPRRAAGITARMPMRKATASASAALGQKIVPYR